MQRITFLGSPFPGLLKGLGTQYCYSSFSCRTVRVWERKCEVRFSDVANGIILFAQTQVVRLLQFTAVFWVAIAKFCISPSNSRDIREWVSQLLVGWGRYSPVHRRLHRFSLVTATLLLCLTSPVQLPGTPFGRTTSAHAQIPQQLRSKAFLLNEAGFG